MRRIATVSEPPPPEGPLGAARGILLGALLSSVLWLGLAITLRTLW